MTHVNAATTTIRMNRIVYSEGSRKPRFFSSTGASIGGAAAVMVLPPPGSPRALCRRSVGLEPSPLLPGPHPAQLGEGPDGGPLPGPPDERGRRLHLRAHRPGRQVERRDLGRRRDPDRPLIGLAPVDVH